MVSRSLLSSFPIRFDVYQMGFDGIRCSVFELLALVKERCECSDNLLVTARSLYRNIQLICPFSQEDLKNFAYNDKNDK